MHCTLILSHVRLLAHPMWCCCSVANLCLALRDPTDCSTPGFSVPHHLPEFAPSSCPMNQWCHPAISSCHPLILLPSIFPSIRVFSNESAVCLRWPKYWSFSFSISPSKEYSGLISFKINCFDLLAVQGILKSSPAPQFESINSLVFCLLYCPALTSVHDYCKDQSLDYMDLCQQSHVFDV